MFTAIKITWQIKYLFMPLLIVWTSPLKANTTTMVRARRARRQTWDNWGNSRVTRRRRITRPIINVLPCDMLFVLVEYTKKIDFIFCFNTQQSHYHRFAWRNSSGWSVLRSNFNIIELVSKISLLTPGIFDALSRYFKGSILPKTKIKHVWFDSSFRRFREI